MKKILFSTLLLALSQPLLSYNLRFVINEQLLSDSKLNKLAIDSLYKKPADELIKPHPLRLFRLLWPLPVEMQVRVLETLNSVDLLKLHETLTEIKNEIPQRIAFEEKVFKDVFINEQGQFAGNSIFVFIKIATQYKTARVLGCQRKDVTLGDYQPLKDASNEEIRAGFPCIRLRQDEINLIREFNIFNETMGINKRTMELHKTAMDCPPLLTLLPYIEEFKKKLTTEDKFWQISCIDAIRYVDAHADKFITRDGCDLLIDERRNLLDSYLDSSYHINHELKKIYVLAIPPSLQQALLKKIHFKKGGNFQFGHIIVMPESTSDIQKYNIQKNRFYDELEKFGYYETINCEIIENGIRCETIENGIRKKFKIFTPRKSLPYSVVDFLRPFYAKLVFNY